MLGCSGGGQRAVLVLINGRLGVVGVMREHSGWGCCLHPALGAMGRRSWAGRRLDEALPGSWDETGLRCPPATSAAPSQLDPTRCPMARLCLQPPKAPCTEPLGDNTAASPGPQRCMCCVPTVPIPIRVALFCSAKADGSRRHPSTEHF